MTKKQMGQLIENLKIDGSLTGTITCYQPNGVGDIEIISGHHRTEAAVAAGITDVPCLVITTELSHERKVALQLSHNSIVGQDDPATLAELYMALDLDAKKFSGLDDDMFGGFDKVDLSGISAGSVKYQAVTIHFLPEDEAEVSSRLEEIKKTAQVHHHAANLASFDAFFDALVATKRIMNVQNSATAIAVMADLAHERLLEIEAENQKAQQNQQQDQQKKDNATGGGGSSAV